MVEYKLSSFLRGESFVCVLLFVCCRVFPLQSQDSLVAQRNGVNRDGREQGLDPTENCTGEACIDERETQSVRTRHNWKWRD